MTKYDKKRSDLKRNVAKQSETLRNGAKGSEIILKIFRSFSLQVAHSRYKSLNFALLNRIEMNRIEMNWREYI